MPFVGYEKGKGRNAQQSSGSETPNTKKNEKKSHDVRSFAHLRQSDNKLSAINHCAFKASSRDKICSFNLPKVNGISVNINSNVRCQNSQTFVVSNFLHS